MAFINDINDIKKRLDHLLRREILGIPVVYEPAFNPSNFIKNKYLRHWCENDSEIEKFAKGASRQYEWKMVLYNKTTAQDKEEYFADMSKDVERIERFLHNYSQYTLSGKTQWHQIEVNISYPKSILDTDPDIEDDIENVQPVEFNLIIYRNCMEE